MNRKASLVLFFALIILQTFPSSAQKPDRSRNFDEPEEEENLNRELWEFVKKTPYQDILPYLAEAHRSSQLVQKAEVELPNGWRLAPAGTQVEVGRLPYEAVLFAGKLVVLDTGYYYNEPQEVSIVDVQTGTVVKTLRIKSLFPSAVIGSEGDLYISGGFDQKIYRVSSQFEIVREYDVNGFAGGLAATGQGHLAVGYMASKNAKGDYVSGKLAILNTETGRIEHETETGYFPYAIQYLQGRIYVTLLGENKLLAFNKQAELTKSFVVGSHPQEMCTDGQRLYVVNTTADSLSVLDLRSNRLLPEISVAAPGSRFGRSPTSCTVERNRLSVTLADINAVAVLDKQSGKRQGLIPTGWYPTKVLARNGELLVLNAKGIRARRPNRNAPQPTGPSPLPEYVLNLLKGTVSIIPELDIRKNLSSWTQLANSASPIFDLTKGFKAPIRHVFYVIKENRTYDQVLGDLPRGNGDPQLTLFGKEITPIQHQLADDFVTLDNFFVNGEISVLGHSFTTSGYASPFLEWLGNVSYSQRWKGYPFGTVPAVTSPTYLWDALDQKQVDYRIYGENYFLFTRAYRIFVELYGADSYLAKKFYDKTLTAAGAGDRGNEFYQFARAFYGRANTRPAAYELLGDPTFATALSQFLTGDESFAVGLKKDLRLRRKFADYLYHYPFNYRSWDLKYSDLQRVLDWQRDFEAQLRSGQVATLHYIWLPNDHTDGSRTVILNPFQFVAQNDAALGRLIEVISHSRIWKNSLILVVEDDAQNGPDHVDATRTTAFAVGPYVKRGALINDRYDQLSMLRTIEILLGLEPLNLGDRLAAPMFGIFTDIPNYLPFTPALPSDKLTQEDRRLYQEFGRSK
jgi:DNA-binding beta-propeller fold protein YncE